MKTKLAACGVLLAGLVVLGSCASRAPQADIQKASDTINADSLMAEIKTLSSDEFEGRKPGSEGEKKTLAYLQQQFQEMGLKPGNPDGTWLQKVPLAGIATKPEIDISVKGAKVELTNIKDYVAFTPRYVPEVVEKDTPIVF